MGVPRMGKYVWSKHLLTLLTYIVSKWKQESQQTGHHYTSLIYEEKYNITVVASYHSNMFYCLSIDEWNLISVSVLNLK